MKKHSIDKALIYLPLKFTNAERLQPQLFERAPTLPVIRAMDDAG